MKKISSVLNTQDLWKFLPKKSPLLVCQSILFDFGYASATDLTTTMQVVSETLVTSPVAIERSALEPLVKLKDWPSRIKVHVEIRKVMEKGVETEVEDYSCEVLTVKGLQMTFGKDVCHGVKDWPGRVVEYRNDPDIVDEAAVSAMLKCLPLAAKAEKDNISNMALHQVGCEQGWMMASDANIATAIPTSLKDCQIPVTVGGHFKAGAKLDYGTATGTNYCRLVFEDGGFVQAVVTDYKWPAILGLFEVERPVFATVTAPVPVWKRVVNFYLEFQKREGGNVRIVVEDGKAVWEATTWTDSKPAKMIGSVSIPPTTMTDCTVETTSGMRLSFAFNPKLLKLQLDTMEDSQALAIKYRGRKGRLDKSLNAIGTTPFPFYLWLGDGSKRMQMPVLDSSELITDGDGMGTTG